MRKCIFLVIYCLTLVPVIFAQPDLKDKFPGTYKFVGDTLERKQKSRAVNGFINQIPFFVRPFYKSKIRSGFPIPDEITITRNGKGLFSVDASLDKPVFSDLNKTPEKYKSPDGTTTEVQRKYMGLKLLEKFVDGRGTRVNSYELSSDGQKMIYRVRFKSSRLSKPVAFKLTYEKNTPVKSDAILNK